MAGHLTALALYCRGSVSLLRQKFRRSVQAAGNNFSMEHGAWGEKTAN